jgi:ATP-binding cassette subfamily B protein
MSKLHQIWRIRNFLTGQLFGTIIDAVPLLGLVPAIFILQWHLAMWVLALTGIIFVIVVFFLRPLGRRHMRVVHAEQARGSHLVETIYGMRTIKSLALEGRRRREWDVLVAEATSARHDFGLLANHPQTWSLPFERLIYSGSLVLGAYALLTQPDMMTAGTLIAFALLSMRIAQPLVKMAHLLQDVAEVRGAVGEVASIMNSPPEQARSGTGLRLPIEREISFEDVRFRYAPGAPLALDKVSFRIAQGRMFGIMGRSGSGKTTVTRLLQGLHPNYEGIIKIAGMDLREIDLSHLRTNIGVVPQENFLFSGSVRDNISMAKPGATFAEIVHAAQLAGAEEFIERMPRGYDTHLEEGAVNLSGGQRQRLAMARALLIDPPVLILDEATSALDAESEAIINANLQRIAQGRTIICISHRLSMLVPADAILVLERGQVYDIGRHEELLHRCDIYKHLWYQQNRHIDRGAVHAQLAIARSPQA